MPSTYYRGLSFSPSGHRSATELSCSKARFPELLCTDMVTLCYSNCLVLRNTQLFSSEKQMACLSVYPAAWRFNTIDLKSALSKWAPIRYKLRCCPYKWPQTWVSLPYKWSYGPKLIPLFWAETWPKALYPQAHHPNHHPESTKQQQPDSSC